jgi:hypothetical protein
MTEPKKPPLVEPLSARGLVIGAAIVLLALLVARVAAEVFARLTMHWSSAAVKAASSLLGIALAVAAAHLWRRLTRVPPDD